MVRVVDWQSFIRQRSGFDSFMWGNYPTSLRNVSGSTRLTAHAWNNARKGTSTAGKSPYNLSMQVINYLSHNNYIIQIHNFSVSFCKWFVIIIIALVWVKRYHYLNDLFICKNNLYVSFSLLPNYISFSIWPNITLLQN